MEHHLHEPRRPRETPLFTDPVLESSGALDVVLLHPEVPADKLHFLDEEDLSEFVFPRHCFMV